MINPPAPAKPRNPFAEPEGGGVSLHCPVCGTLVRLPATECPQCHANLRTGEKPEEYVPLWKRKKTKLFLLLILLAIPPSIYGIISSESDEGVAAWVRAKLGSCAEPPEKWQSFSQEEFEQSVKGGYSSWNKGENTRVTGQSAKGPETPEEAARPESEKIISRDNQAYFATTLISNGPAQSLKPQDNWYSQMSGEWDVAFIINSGKPDETMIAGEWTVTWINNGQAIQDVFSVPYQWAKAPDGFEPIQMTSVRTHNPKRQDWEGFHILNGSMIYFWVAKTQSDQILERYKLESGPLVAWLYEDVTSDSFKVSISQSEDQGGTWIKLAEVWCKRRQTVIP